MYLPLPIYTHLQRNLTHLVSTDDTKYTIVDQNVRIMILFQNLHLFSPSI
jgi:hypothetical protein